MTDILFGNNNRPVLKLLAKRSLKARKNTIAVLAIMLATLLFTSLFTIAISLQTAMQESNMRTTGTSAHTGIKRLSWEEYEKLLSDTEIKDIGYSIIIGNAVGDDFNKTPTELRYGDETYTELTFNTPDTGHLPEQKNEIATSRIVLDAMGLPDKVGTQMELTFTTDADTFTDSICLTCRPVIPTDCSIAISLYRDRIEVVMELIKFSMPIKANIAQRAPPTRRYILIIPSKVCRRVTFER